MLPIYADILIYTLTLLSRSELPAPPGGTEAEGRLGCAYPFRHLYQSTAITKNIKGFNCIQLEWPISFMSRLVTQQRSPSTIAVGRKTKTVLNQTNPKIAKLSRLLNVEIPKIVAEVNTPLSRVPGLLSSGMTIYRSWTKVSVKAKCIMVLTSSRKISTRYPRQDGRRGSVFHCSRLL